MIRYEDTYKIGKITKAHGLKGEVSFHFDDDIFDRTDTDYLICDIDGILVPFFIEEYRFRSDNAALVKFEDIDNAEAAQKVVGSDVYFEKKIAAESDEDEMSLYYFVGFTVVETDGSLIGKITDIDDNTENWLFVVERANGEGEVLIPAHEEFICDINHDERQIVMDLPLGILDL